MGLILGLLWGLVYSGPALEHVCDGLKPGYCYQARLYCISEGGQSPVSHCTKLHALVCAQNISRGSITSNLIGLQRKDRKQKHLLFCFFERTPRLFLMRLS